MDAFVDGFEAAGDDGDVEAAAAGPDLEDVGAGHAVDADFVLEDRLGLLDLPALALEGEEAQGGRRGVLGHDDLGREEEEEFEGVDGVGLGAVDVHDGLDAAGDDRHLAGDVGEGELDGVGGVFVGEQVLGGVLQAVEEGVEEGRRFAGDAAHALDGADDLADGDFVVGHRRVRGGLDDAAGGGIGDVEAALDAVHFDVAQRLEVGDELHLLAGEGIHAHDGRDRGGVDLADDEGAVGVVGEGLEGGAPGGFRAAAHHDVAVDFPPGDVAVGFVAEEHRVLLGGEGEGVEAGEGAEVHDPPVAFLVADEGGAELHEVGADFVHADDVQPVEVVHEDVVPLELLVQPRNRNADGRVVGAGFGVWREGKDAAVRYLLGDVDRAVGRNRQGTGMVELRFHPLGKGDILLDCPAWEVLRDFPAGCQGGGGTAVADGDDLPGVELRNVDRAVGMARDAVGAGEAVGQVLDRHRVLLRQRRRREQQQHGRRRPQEVCRSRPHGSASRRQAVRRLLRGR